MKTPSGSGSPHEWNNPHASDALPEIRKLVLQEKKYKEADIALPEKMRVLTTSRTSRWAIYG